MRRAEVQQAEDEAEVLRRLRAREEGIEATLAAHKARLAQQVPSQYILAPFLPWSRPCYCKLDGHGTSPVWCMLG